MDLCPNHRTPRIPPVGRTGDRGPESILRIETLLAEASQRQEYRRNPVVRGPPAGRRRGGGLGRSVIPLDAACWRTADEAPTTCDTLRLGQMYLH